MAGWAARFLDGPVVEGDDEDSIYGSGGEGPPENVWMAWDEEVGWVIGEPSDEGAVRYRLVRSGIDYRFDGDPLLSDTVIGYYEVASD
jgi:hypothetical protein